jgi:hypothetical protein
MRKKRDKWIQPEWDCHNKTYEEVENELGNWILLKQDYLPLPIITGNSIPMRKRVIRIIEGIGFDWIDHPTNSGKIIVTNG